MLINDTHIEAGQAMSPKARQAFYAAVIEYQALGVEPQGLPREAAAAWVIAKKDIDNAKAFVEAGKRGGKAASKVQKADHATNPPTDPATKGGTEGGTKGGTEGAMQGGTDPATKGGTNPDTAQKASPLGVIEKEIESINTPLSNARADNLVLIVENEAPEAHTLDEVRGAFFSQGFGDGEAAQAFYDFYAAQGWAYGNGRPITDINAAARRWMREEGRRAKPPAQRQQVPAKAPEMDWSGFEDADAYLDRVEAERRARDGGQ